LLCCFKPGPNCLCTRPPADVVCHHVFGGNFATVSIVSRTHPSMKVCKNPPLMFFHPHLPLSVNLSYHHIHLCYHNTQSGGGGGTRSGSNEDGSNRPRVV
jgi:hypothetical protein